MTRHCRVALSSKTALSVSEEMTCSCHAVNDSIFFPLFGIIFYYFHHPHELRFLEDNISLFFNVVTITILLLLLLNVNFLCAVT